MKKPQESSITYRYDRQHLYVTSTISLSGRDGRIIGTRQQTDTYDKEAAEEILRELNQDKVHWEAELKKVKTQLEPLTSEETNIDEEFVKKVTMAVNFGQKRILESKKDNTEKVLKDINWQLDQVKKAMNTA